MKLNPTPEIYKEFGGKNTERMPILMAEKRVPLSVTELMEARLKYGEELPHWMVSYFDTGDAVVYHPDGRIKIVLDSKHLRKITPESQLLRGALVLSDKIYNTLQGQEFKKSELEKRVGKLLTKEQVKSNLIWQALARDQKLLDEYADFIFNQAMKDVRHGRNMGIYLDSKTDVFPKLRMWCVEGHDGHYGANGINSLNTYSGLLIGVNTKGANDPKK